MNDPDQGSTTDQAAEAPTRATVSRRSAIGMLVGGVAVVFVAAVAYMVVPGMLSGITGSGCVG